MDASAERECSALGCLFQQIILDMKNGAPLWEDLISKATKLHTCLKAAILAISAYLEAFQKIADAATNARGATREIGTALTRICLRHKAVETRVKSFTSAIMDCLIIPLQDKLEDWKKSLVYLDKEHAKEYKKARTELKKTSSDTLRLQKKKARKGLQQQQIYGTLPHAVSQGNASSATDVELGRLLESSAAVVQEKRQTLEETERKAVRAALLEERGRFCQFAKFLKPVLDEEIAMLMEMTHLQEVAEQLEKHTALPQQLPPASEQVITDLKGRDPSQWSLATPPSSPSLSLGSRKSSVCSISSLTSSSSGSCKSHPSPSAGYPSSAWHRSVSQQVSCTLPQTDRGSQPTATSTWPDLQQETARVDSQDPNAANERPHTISSAYEKGHQRPALSVYTFQAPEQSSSQPASPVSNPVVNAQLNAARLQQRKNSSGSLGRERPPIPNRCSSLERPTVPARVDSDPANQGSNSPRAKTKLPIPAHLAKELASQQPHLFHQPMYVNMHELASLAASRAQEMHPPPPPPPTTTSNDIATTDNNTKTSETTKTVKEITDTILSSTTNVSNSNVEYTERLSVSAIVQRRNSLQQANKPAPPTRRVSAIVGDSFDDRASNHSDDLDSLPPPPAFLLEGSSPPSAAGSPASQRRSISVSETVRTLTELRHTPASPSLLRRKVTVQAHTYAHAQLTPEGKTLTRVNAGSRDRNSSPDSRNSQQSIQGPGGVAHSFMAALNAKLTSSVTLGSSSTGENSANNSPKPTRKLTVDQQQQQNSNRSSRTSNEFLDTFNARLSHQQPQSQRISMRSASVRRLMANRVPILDPIQVRGSLMDQIRRGTSLRKTAGPINDRSAPKIY
ncbi:protein MTSS 2-like isoform X2 [Phymastichus coffea]|uniref:protein MTSS 2-like isoform X2 n=1 Tax=Phymastichus coffea TaxID=108790 RepID=UPI00273C46F6|nr:protein MTSS 2-like isoform X2 [Phymastichus coffea]